MIPAPSLAPPSGRAGIFGIGGGGINPFGDFAGPATGGGGGWTVQAGVFPFPGLSFGWSNPGARNNGHHQQAAGGVFAHTLNPGITPAEAQEQARIQQRNALIAFVIMILLFTLRKSFVMW